MPDFCLPFCKLALVYIPSSLLLSSSFLSQQQKFQTKKGKLTPTPTYPSYFVCFFLLTQLRAFVNWPFFRLSNLFWRLSGAFDSGELGASGFAVIVSLHGGASGSRIFNLEGNGAIIGEVGDRVPSALGGGELGWGAAVGAAKEGPPIPAGADLPKRRGFTWTSNRHGRLCASTTVMDGCRYQWKNLTPLRCFVLEVVVIVVETV